MGEVWSRCNRIYARVAAIAEQFWSNMVAEGITNMKNLILEWWVKRKGNLHGAVNVSDTYLATDTMDVLNRIDDIMNDPDFVSLSVHKLQSLD
ncbi:MAG: hypothetical protein JWP44_5114 [Mucilaginibacter sp.]|nr:hypothetical protein [Mucilaginibacter sp.]